MFKHLKKFFFDLLLHYFRPLQHKHHTINEVQKAPTQVWGQSNCSPVALAGTNKGEGSD